MPMALTERTVRWLRRAAVAASAALALLGLTASALAYTIYVSNEKDNTVTVIDSNTLQVTNTLKVGRRPRGIALGKDGKLLYVCASDDDGIEVIDTASMSVVRTLRSGPTRSC